MPPESLESKIILVLLDKGALALLLALFGYWFTRELEKYKNELKKESDAEAAQRQKIEQLETEKRTLEATLDKQSRDLKIQFLERQLSEFYWPLLLRLQKDSAIWHKIPDLHHAPDQVPSDIGKQMEKQIIQPNHEEAVRIIEAKIHLAEADEQLFSLLKDYMRHVAVYVALRSLDKFDANPRTYKEPFPADLIAVTESRTRALQTEYNVLVGRAKAEDLAESNTNLERSVAI